MYLAMDTRDGWREQAVSEAGGAKKPISPPRSRRYKITLFLRLARRVAVFSSECEECRRLQNQIINLEDDLVGIPRMTRQDFRNYLSVIKGITKHLKKTHGLVEERQYIKRYVFIAVTVGLFLVVLGLILFSFGITLLALNITVPALLVRIAFGCTVGYFLDKRAKKRGRVL